jgi:hypothetical protein
VYKNYCYKHADLAYATSACVTCTISNTFCKMITYIQSIFKIISIGSTNVDPITATSAYDDVADMYYLLLTVAYMPRQQCKMYIKVPKFLYILIYYNFV